MALPPSLQALYERLRSYNSGPNAPDNPRGFSRGGHLVGVFDGFVQDLTEFGRDVATAALISAGQSVQDAEATADDRVQTGKDRAAAAASAREAALFDPTFYLRKEGAKLDAGGSLFKGPSAGNSNAGMRGVANLATYRGTGDVTGAIVFLSPAGVEPRQIMHQLQVQGFLYNPPAMIDLAINGYLFDPTLAGGSGAPYFALVGANSIGTVTPQIRWARAANGRSALILGDVGTVWSFPAISITSALLSASVTDAYCTGWTSELVTELSAYTTLMGVTTLQSMTGKLNLSGGTMTGPLSFAPGPRIVLTGGTSVVNYNAPGLGNRRPYELRSGANTLDLQNIPEGSGDLHLGLLYTAGTLAFAQTIRWKIGGGLESTTFADTGVTLTAGVIYTAVFWRENGTLYGAIA